MIFTPTPIPGAFVIDLEPVEDARGFFARTWCRDEFAAHGLETGLTQCNFSYSRTRGTLRGMHYQVAPHTEVKLVRCVRGAVYDVVADLRPGSPTYRRWVGVELSAENRRALYVPAMFAHGFQTLSDHTEVFYQVVGSYHRESERGVRWDDPALGIRWPLDVTVMSDRDRGHPLLVG